MTSANIESTMAVPNDDAVVSHGAVHHLDELLTVDDVAVLLKVSKSWVYEHTRSRGMPRSERLPHIKIGKYVRFDVRAVREFLLRRSKIA
jgi:excisionase family DNA binding protein